MLRYLVIVSLECNKKIQFFNLIDMNEEYRLRDIFCVDARSIAIYESLVVLYNLT